MNQAELPRTEKASARAPDITPLLNLLCHFQPLSPGVETFFHDHVRNYSVRKRKLLLKEGSRCEHIYFIVKGAIRGFTREGQKDITTWINVEDQLVSSIFSFGERTPSIENMQAMEDCDLLVMSYDDLEALYEQYPEFNAVARKVLQVYYADAERRAFIARLTKAGERYSYFLLHHQQLANRIPLKYIASYLGMTLETLSRVRKRFSSKP